jgi:hypothetical protein
VSGNQRLAAFSLADDEAGTLHDKGKAARIRCIRLPVYQKQGIKSSPLNHTPS